MAKLLRYLLPLIVLGVGYLSFVKLGKEEKQAPPIMPQRRMIETEATLLKRENYTVTLTSQGIVRPHNETSLTPRVSGRIISISPKFESGSFFSKDEILVTLDPDDFEAAVISAEARLARSEASLAQEEARAKQALLDWNDLGYTDPPTDLVLRKPQLKEARANVKASRAELSDTKRDLDRTRVRAPYDGRVKERLVGLGQSVSPGTELGEVFSTDFAEVRLSLSARELPKVTLPDNPDDTPIPVTLTDALVKENPYSWKGKIVRTEGQLDEKSRKLFVIARVDDPFSLRNRDQPSLRIGQPIRAVLEGEKIENVFIIPRETLRRPNEITLINPEGLTLKRTVIDHIWSDQESLIVRDGIEEGWHLVTSKLAATPNGARVKIIEPEETKAAVVPKEGEKPKT